MPLAVKAAAVPTASPLVGHRIDRLVQELVGLTRSQVTGLFDHACVTLNGAPCPEAGGRLAAGDRVEVRYDPHTRYHSTPRPRGKLGFEIVHEDRDLIVVNKPAELLTVPTARRETDTLHDKVADYVLHVGKGRGAFVVHRLDRGVSGLLVFAKTRGIAGALKKDFAAARPAREYVAIVAGRVERPHGTFESRLATDADLNRFSTKDAEKGEIAITHYRVEARLCDATLVRVRLETGRRNQIRVHFAEAGHPVLGDPRYFPERAAHPRWPHARLALHARSLGFDHPVTRRPLRFEAPIPAEIERFLAASAGGATDLARRLNPFRDHRKRDRMRSPAR